ncbi:MAG: hypothetical protein ABI151_05860 [Chitinophagaceae bacterium]
MSLIGTRNARGLTQYTLKARVSAPMKLRDIQVLRISGSQEQLLKTYSDFQLTPTVYTVSYPVTGVSANYNQECRDRPGWQGKH